MRWGRKQPSKQTQGVTASATVRSIFELSLPDELVAGDAAGTGWITTRWVHRDTALSVPAVYRARNRVCVTPAMLPVHQFTDEGNVQITTPFLSQPESGIPAVTTYTYTYEDMLFHGWSLWQITELKGSFPARVKRIDPYVVGVGGGGRVTINGVEVDDARLIRFVSPYPPLLMHGARAIRTLYMLDALADAYSDGGQPLGYFTPRESGVEYFDEEAEEGDPRNAETFLSRWLSMRKKRSIGYVPGALDFKQTQFTSRELQLTEARQHAVLEISRLTGVDPEELSVSTTSRTYQNNVDRRQDFIDFTCGGLYTTLEQRLSMNDVTPRGHTVKVSLDAFLRSATSERYASYAIANGGQAWLENDEIRAAEHLPPRDIPQQGTGGTT